MKHGSLFSGIGGFDLAAEWMGWTNVFHCEWNDFGKKILKHYWPDAISYNDITQTDFTIHRGSIDILTGGFPCQPFSAAGGQLGEKHEQYLLDQMLRATFEIMPRWLVAENVYGITSKKFKRILDYIYTQMEAKGYSVQAYNIPATAVAADHERQRIYFIAYSGKKQQYAIKSKNRNIKDEKLIPEKWLQTRGQLELVAGIGDTQIGYYEGKNFEPSVIRKVDAIPCQLDELEAYGNTVIPEMIFQIFKAIEQYELQQTLFE